MRRRAQAVGGRAMARLDDEALLDLRFSQLALPANTGTVAVHMRRLHRDLRQRGLKFRPHFWFAEDWFSPDGVPGIAVPFYLANPRLTRLERHLMGQVEGSNSLWLTRILRHEAGHAIDTAYGLRHRKDWRQIFGRSSERYPADYRPRPASRRYVLHLGHWYAQSHPTEDFAETFAVWLQPRAQWRREYTQWPALRKLEFVDRLMDDIAGKRPQRCSRREVEPIRRMPGTLRTHYRRKTGRYTLDDRRYDRPLRRVFAQDAPQRRALASRFLRESRPQLERLLVRRARLHPYVVKHAFDLLIQRSRALQLRLRHDRRRSKRQALLLLQRVVLDILRRNRENYAL